MPRIKRQLHGGRHGRLTSDQEDRLYLGHLLPPQNRKEPFASVEEERLAWKAHREELMAKFREPGFRPIAHFVFDLNVPEKDLGRWRYEMRRYLAEAGEMTPQEADALEKREPWLTGGPDDIHHDFRRARCAAAWHRWRGRPELAARWAQKQAELEAALAGAKEVG